LEASGGAFFTSQSGTDSASRPEQMRLPGWTIRAISTAPRPLTALAVAVGLYAIAALIAAPATFLPVVSAYFVQVGLSFPVAFAGAALGTLVLIRPAEPKYFLRRFVRERWQGALAVALGFWIGISAFTTYKLSIPDLVPFYADPVLDWLDRTIHGLAPWRITHAYLPQWTEYVLAFHYHVIWYIGWFGTVGFVAFWRDRRRIQYMWSLALTVSFLGSTLAIALSSYGPIFYDRLGGGPAYDGLLLALDASPVGIEMRHISDYLYAAYLDKGLQLGAGISAMPSIHIAIATLNACFFWNIDKRIGAIGWSAVLLTFAGSVHFGWHYAVDAYVPFILVIVIWHATGWTLRTLTPSRDERQAG
jgi:hypothetical protein